MLNGKGILSITEEITEEIKNDLDKNNVTFVYANEVDNEQDI